jgi:murein L,D-transpeptidase YafK
MLPRSGLLLLLLLLCISIQTGAAARERWILIDTAEERLELRDGDEVVLSFPRISLGRGGVSDIHMAGDMTTPRGEFQITRMHDSERYHLFIGLDYPTMEHVDTAHRQGLISNEAYGELLDHAIAHGRFPADSPLGGHIGIHGVGEADPVYHRRFHWTEGCIALTDAQVDVLAELVNVGTRVVIR